MSGVSYVSERVAGEETHSRPRRPDHAGARIQKSSRQERPDPDSCCRQKGAPARVQQRASSGFSQRRGQASGRHVKESSSAAPSPARRRTLQLSPTLLSRSALLILLLFSAAPQSQAGLHQSQNRLALASSWGRSQKQGRNRTEGAAPSRLLGTFHATWRQTTWYKTTLRAFGANKQPKKQQDLQRTQQQKLLGNFHAVWRQTTWYKTTLGSFGANKQQQQKKQQQLQRTQHHKQQQEQQQRLRQKQRLKMQQGSLAGDAQGRWAVGVGRSEQAGGGSTFFSGGGQSPQHPLSSQQHPFTDEQQQQQQQQQQQPLSGQQQHQAIQTFTRGPLDRGRIRGLVRPYGGRSVSAGKATGASQGGKGSRSTGVGGRGTVAGAAKRQAQAQAAAVRPVAVKARPDMWRLKSLHPPRGKLPYALRRRRPLPTKKLQPRLPLPVARPSTLATPGPGAPGALPLPATGSALGGALTLEQAKQAKIGIFDPSSVYSCTVWVTESGDKGFASIQGAIDSLDPTAGPATVCVGPGTYSERVTVHEGLDNVTLAGSGVKTVITSTVGALSAGGPFQAATVTVYGNFFRGSHFILENSLFTVTDPCPVVTTSANRTTWVSVGFISWVDTVALRAGHHLFQNCIVSGLTDIIWGFGRAAFVDSVIWARNFPSPTTRYTGFIAVFGTDKASEGIISGAVFQNCLVMGDGSMCLGRPYRAQQHVVYADCYLGRNVCSDGWGDYNGYLAFQTFDFREFRSYGPGANPTGRKWGNVSSGPPPEMFSVPNFLTGTD